jgi:hypothetical protein
MHLFIFMCIAFIFVYIISLILRIIGFTCIGIMYLIVYAIEKFESYEKKRDLKKQMNKIYPKMY